MDIDEFILEHESLDKNSLNYLIPELLLRRCKKLAEDEGRAEGNAQGRAEGRAEGRVEGRAEGEAIGIAQGRYQTLKFQLEARFGPLPEQLLSGLACAKPAQLERLALTLLDAASAEQALNAAGLRP